MVDDIARNDLAAATATMILRDTMQARLRAAGRYQILKQPEFIELYNSQSEVFRRTLDSLRRQSGSGDLGALLKAHSAYSVLADRMFGGEEIGERELKDSAEQLEKAIMILRGEQQKILENKLIAARDREQSTAAWAIGLAFSGVFLALSAAAALVYTFSSSISKLQKATHRIAAGDFDHDPHIPVGDEIGALAQDFMGMAVRLKELEQISLDASPLTRLPGNIAIERSINRRLRDRESFAMCYLDLDNFKSYNDRYGYIMASEVLKKSGEIIYDAVHTLNDPDAFVGHIGGDDFVVIIDAERAKAACQNIIAGFDAMVPSFYSEEDRSAGFIKGVDRYGVPREFPLLSISIAALTCQPGQYATAAEIASVAASVKDHVKESTGSNYIIVRDAGGHDV